jgi:hypothetical protein
MIKKMWISGLVQENENDKKDHFFSVVVRFYHRCVCGVPMEQTFLFKFRIAAAYTFF